MQLSQGEYRFVNSRNAASHNGSIRNRCQSQHIYCPGICHRNAFGFGHNPTIAIPDFEGEVKWTPRSLEDSSLRIVVQALSLTVTDDISKSDRSEIERRMHEEVLETDGFAEIIYECSQVSSVQKMGEGLFAAVLNGDLTLHGVTLNQPISARVTLTRRHFAGCRRIFHSPE